MHAQTADRYCITCQLYIRTVPIDSRVKVATLYTSENNGAQGIPPARM